MTQPSGPACVFEILAGSFRAALLLLSFCHKTAPWAWHYVQISLPQSEQWHGTESQSYVIQLQ
ncbi:MAG: hypothetical protein MJE68_26000, partial [Proteobacteria bacterium]|nr:hypothetical protein [Pseudomonadota bacterium]